MEQQTEVPNNELLPLVDSGEINPIETRPMKTMTVDNANRQRIYVDEQRKKGGDGLGVVFQEAFINGMRDLGYKSPAWALSELVDNSIQAGAERVQVLTGFKSDKGGKKNPDYIAVVDDGNGMIPEMISYSVRWGGSDRINDRSGFGRFGYGLPSACVSIGKVYTVYSKTSGEGWHSVKVDLGVLGKVGVTLEETLAQLNARPCKLPDWLIRDTAGSDKPEPGELSSPSLADLDSGTVVVIEDLDKMSRDSGWTVVSAIESKFLTHFGLVYRHTIPDISIFVGKRICEVLDPLFQMPHARYMDADEQRAIALETKTIRVSLDNGVEGSVKIRASILPPTFCWPNWGSNRKPNPGEFTERWKLVKDQHLNGLIVCRQGRQLDTVSPDWTKFQNNDRFLKIELDFDASLDEAFGVTTAKQQVRIYENLMEKLKADGKEGGNLVKMVQDMRRKWSELNNELKAKLVNADKDTETEPASVAAMKKAVKVVGDRPAENPEQEEKAKARFKEEVNKTARDSGKPVEEVEKTLRDKLNSRPWDIDYESVKEGPFYLPERLDTQRRVIVNTDHPFYTRVYDAFPDVAPAIELLLFVLASREMDASKNRVLFYQAERMHWSAMLRAGLLALEDDQSLTDAVASELELMDPTEDGEFKS